MLELPKSFSLNDFRKSSYFAEEMIHFHEDALDPNNSRFYFSNDQDVDYSTYSEYQKIGFQKGYAVSFFYQLAKEYEQHDECINAYQDLIINCDGTASNIAEFKLYDSDHSRIAPTAHSVALHHLHELYSIILDCCGDKDDANYADLISQNLSEIQSISSVFLIDKSEKQRLISRLNRENSLVSGCYSNGIQKTEITSVMIRKVVAKANNNEDQIYSTSWLNTQKRKGQWPKEIKGGGPNPYTWDFTVLKPYLVKQFPQVDWGMYNFYLPCLH